MKLRPKIVAGILAAVMVMTSLPYPAGAVRAEEPQQEMTDIADENSEAADETKDENSSDEMQDKEEDEAQESTDGEDADSEQQKPEAGDEDISDSDEIQNDGDSEVEKDVEDESAKDDKEDAEGITDKPESGNDGKTPDENSSDNTQNEERNEAQKTTDGEGADSEQQKPEEEVGDEDIPDADEIQVGEDNVLDSGEDKDAGIGLAAVDDSGKCGDNVTWELTDGTLVIRGTGPMWDYHWADGDGFPNGPWMYNNDINRVIIEAGVTSIGSGVFSACENLMDVEIPASVISIGNGAFTCCFNLTGVEISSSVTSIGKYAFYCCESLTSMEIPTSVTSIETGTFQGCISLMSIEIPISVTSIGDWAFSECISLTSVEIPTNVSSIGRWAFQECKSLVSVEIPASVVSIGSGAFSLCENLTSVKIPISVVSIGSGAFSACENLTSVEIPAGVTSIGRETFKNCRSLTSVEIPISVISIGEFAFQACEGLTSVKIPENVTNIERGIFYQCSGLTSVKIPKGVTSIGNVAFYGSSGLNSVIIPASVIGIEDNAFGECTKLNDVYYSGSKSDWEAIQINLGNECLTDATIHYNSTGMGDADNNKKKIGGTLRSGDGCTVQWLCSYSLNTDGSPYDARVDIIVHDSTSAEEELYLYSETSASGLPFPWELEPYNIPKSAIKTLYIEGMQAKKLRIVADSFKDYTGLENVVLSHVTGIDSNAFNGCTSLKNFGFLYGETDLAVIDNGAFANCSSLTSMDIPKGVTNIGDSAFSGCNSLTSVGISRSVTSIGDSAFRECKKLSDVYYSGSKSDWETIQIKSGNECLTDVTIHDQNDSTLDVQMRTFEFTDPGTVKSNWGWNSLLNRDSGDYIHGAAITALVLSAAAERSQDAIESMLAGDNFGVDVSLIDSINYNDSLANINNPACTFAHKTIDNDGKIEHIIIIVARGTSSFADGVTDYNSITDNFRITANNIWISFAQWLNREELSGEKLASVITAENTIFFVTGHSLGGAVANRIAYRLNQVYGSKNVYAYTFASPPTEGQNSTVAPNIFNLLCTGDPVPYLGVFTDGRYGIDLWFADSCRTPVGFPLLGFFDNHVVESYMKHLLDISDGSFRKVKKGGGVWCPVDLRIYDSLGQLVGSVTDNTVDKENMTGSVMIVLSGEDNDEKNFYFLEDDTYTIELIGTGEGTLTYAIRETYADKNTVIEKRYDNVQLSEGKKMSSVVSVWDTDNPPIDTSDLIDTPDIQLFVTDENGTAIKKVLPDGKGTEIPIDSGDNPGSDKPENKPDENKPETDKPENKPGENKPNTDKPGDNSGGDGQGNHTGSDNQNPQNSSAESSAQSTDAKVTVETWKPKTPDEKKRYACVGSETVRYTLSADNSYRVVIENAVHGPMCFQSFEAVLGDYTIGRTYNIYTLPVKTYSTEQEVQFTIKIPSAIYKEDRKYKMICVTEKGVPIIYEDTDSDPETITVKTDKFYAYALIYK